MVTFWSQSTCEQPFWLWKETQPSTAFAIRSVVSEAQMLVGRIRTWLRMPTRPSGRRYPMKVRVPSAADDALVATEAVSVATESFRSSELAQLCV